MSGVISKITDFFESLPDLLRKYRLWIWVTFFALVVFSIFGFTRFKLDMAMESWFRTDDSTVVVFNKFRDSFGSDDAIYIVYKAKDGDVFSEASLTAVRDLQDKLTSLSLEAIDNNESLLSHIIEIKSLINVSYMQVEGDTLISRDFVGDDNPDTEKTREKLRQEALSHKDYPLFYLSKDTQYGGIFIRTDFGTTPYEATMGENPEPYEMELDTVPETTEEAFTVPKYKTTEMAEYAVFTEEIYDIINQPEFSDVLEFYPVGNPIIMKFFNDVLNIELSIILMITLVLMLSALYYLFRSFSAVIWPISIVILAIILTLGIVSWIGMTMSMMISVLIMLILVVGIADSIHILSGYQFFRRKQYDHDSALRAVMKKSGFACMLTSVTTSSGLLAMIFVPIPPIAKFGISAAIGVLLAFILTVTLLPLLLDIWQPISKKQALRIEKNETKKSLTQRFLEKLEPYAYGYPRLMVVIFLVIGGVSIYGMTKIKVNSNMIELIREGNPVRLSQTIVDAVMGGTQSMEITLDMGEEDGLKDPAVLNAIDKIQQYLKEEQPEFVVRTDSLVNVVKNSYQVLNQNRPEMYIIPQEKKTLQQTLFLFDMANPDDRKLLVTDDYAQGRISIRLKNYGSIEYLPFFEAVQKKAEEIFSPLKQQYPDMEVDITGGLALMMQLVDYMSWSQVQSFGLALIVITIMLLFVFGSPKIGLMGMIPNIFPVVTTFGVMGFFDISLDADTLIIAPIVIGIAVDDTIHFLTHFRTELLETDNVITAIVNSIREVGQAICFSTVILVLGFLALVFSSHLGMAHFGYLTAVAFISALLADLLLLPSLCVLFNKRGEKERVPAPLSALAKK
ncbi:MMPL family transporter [bacterium]|nr:MMPL family transporter [bacterium]